MLDAARRGGAGVVGDVVEVHERVVVDVVVVAVIADRAVGAVERTRAFVLLVGFPRDSGRLEQIDEVAAGALGILRRVVVVEDPKVRPGLEPEVVGQARVHVGRVVVVLGVRGRGEGRAVDVWGRGGGGGGGAVGGGAGAGEEGAE